MAFEFVTLYLFVDAIIDAKRRWQTIWYLGIVGTVVFFGIYGVQIGLAMVPPPRDGGGCYAERDITALPFSWDFFHATVTPAVCWSAEWFRVHFYQALGLPLPMTLPEWMK